jgi:predicted DNA-binding protein YlxM (UPF0122 family)
MARYFEYFPKVSYDIDGADLSNYQLVTNILARVGFVREILNNASAYRYYTIRDGDRPEILADKLYGDPEAHWIILYANNMKDAQYDWPLDNKSFINHIKDKYGSIEAAKTGIHHYEKVIERHNSSTNTTTTKRINIDEGSYYIMEIFIKGSLSLGNGVVGQSSNAIGTIVYLGSQSSTHIVRSDNNLAFEDNEIITITPANTTALILSVKDTSLDTGAEEYYYDELTATQSVNTYEVSGDTITETIYKKAVTYYDYEDELNESKRNIRLVKKEFYSQIMNELKTLMKYSPDFIRTVR